MNEIGLHDDVPIETYLRWPGLSKSAMSALLRSPAHYRVHMADESPPTTAQQKAWDFGTAVHLAALEPHLFADRVDFKPPGHPSSKTHKRLLARVREERPDVLLFTPDEMQRISDMGKAVRSHPMVSAFMHGAKTEVSAVWKHEETGVLCKGRADAWNEEHGVILDLKTCPDARRIPFRRTIHALNYHIQAAHYLTGWDALGHGDTSFAFIAIEKKPPYAISVFELAPVWLTHAEVLIDALMALYQRCEATDSWPAYSLAVEEMDMAEWQGADMEAMTRRVDRITNELAQ